MPRLYLHKDEFWRDLLDDPEDIIHALACRILPGQQSRSDYRQHEFRFQVLEYNETLSFEGSPGYFKDCGQEVILLVYEKRVHKRLFQKERPKRYFPFPMAAIGLRNRHVVLDTQYRFWDGDKERVPEDRKHLLDCLVAYYIDHLADFAQYFTIPMDKGDGIL
jgi:hypothetical protein